MVSRKSEPEPPLRLPIKLGPVSNGEFFPEPMSPRLRAVQREALRRSEEHARRKNVSRRDFLASSCGAATVLLALDAVSGCGSSSSGGHYDVDPEAQLDEAVAERSLGGDEFVFDVQTHRVGTDRRWFEENWQFRNFARRAADGWCREPERFLDCYSVDQYFKEIFLDSDTDMAVLSSLPGVGDKTPLTIQEANATKEALARMEGSPRLQLHTIVMPNRGRVEEALEHMAQAAEAFPVAAWKLYPVWSPDGTGYWLDDEDTGMRAAERARALGIKRLAVHKGLPQAGMRPKYTRPRDVGPAAKANPDLTYLIYHSAYEADRREGPYDPHATRGVDAFIRTVEEHGLAHDGNVYAELGSLWREVMRDPEQASHVLGKLLKHVGEDRILWGTDSIWFGSPQDQLQAFRAFEISEPFQERYGYPALTAERKRKILGLNAARVYGVDVEAARSRLQRDPMHRMRERYRPEATPSHRAYGPTTRREMLALLRANEGLPG